MGFAPDNSTPPEPLPMHFAPPTAPEAGPDQALARMVERMTKISPQSGAEALRELRVAFPDAPLALRVAALGKMMRQQDDAASSVPK
jgi:hypothetical protein